MGNIVNEKYRGISVLSASFEKAACRSIDTYEKQTLLNDLADLDAWCQIDSNVATVRKGLYNYFEEAIIGAYCRYATAKKKAWSPFKNLCADFATSMIPIASGSLLYWFSKDTVWSVGTVGLNVGITLAVVWFLLECFQTAQKRRAYNETWVRHSACYGRLRIALSRFLISNREDGDYECFVEDVFSILEQNYDQFTANLSTHGMVPRKKQEA